MRFDMTSLRLPPGLLDLVLARTSTAAYGGRTRPMLSISHQLLPKRLASSAAVLKPRIVPPEYAHLEYPPAQHAKEETELSSRGRRKRDSRAVSAFDSPAPRPVSVLEERLAALKNATASEEAMVAYETYTEDELLAVYEDLLALPVSENPNAQAQRAVEEPEEDTLAVVMSTARRILSLSADMSALGPEEPVAESSTSSEAFTYGPTTRAALITRLEDIVSNMQAFQSTLADSQASQPNGQQVMVGSPTRLGIITEKESFALLTQCIREADGAAAERVLDLLRRNDLQLAEDHYNSVLGMYAAQGDVDGADQFVTKYLGDFPSERQRDLHIKAHITAVPTTAFPTQALHLLHDYELRALAPPQRTYSRLVTHLFSANSSVAHAHAWDLFSHMRYVAHPQPDAVMYTMMIRACAQPSLSASGEPERALDLFTEMTVDNGIPPTAGVYTATILACARSGRKTYVHEAFRLAKEMLDAHRDARGQSAFTPDRRFFCALLEGAKRIGDLPRVRWILAEMVKQSLEHDAATDTVAVIRERAIQEDVLLHVFHAYASYKPVFKRSMTAVLKDAQPPASQQDPPPSAISQEVLESPREEASDITASLDADFSRIPPQSHAEVIHEAKTLFTRLLEDLKRNHAGNSGTQDKYDGIFGYVQLTPRLLNAYLSVHYSHSPLETWREMFQTLHSELGVPRTTWTYVEFLERCARSKKDERKIALQMAEHAWAEWKSLEDVNRNQNPGAIQPATVARLTERMYAAMIRTLSIAGHLDRAVELVRSFVAQYPPVAIRQPPPKSPLRSTRTNLIASRPLVRSFSAFEVPDDTVPPLLSFTEVEVLHHKLVAAGKAVDIRYLKWVCKAYEGSLRMRREGTLRGVPRIIKDSQLDDAPKAPP